MLTWIFDLIKSIFRGILDAFKTVWGWVQAALPYVALGLAIFFSFGGVLVIAGATFTGWWAAAVVVGLSFLLAPGETAAVLDDVVVAVSEVVDAVAQVAGSAISSAASALFGMSPGALLLAIAGIWIVMNRDKKEETSNV